MDSMEGKEGNVEKKGDFFFFSFFPSRATSLHSTVENN